jgi:hypothetical protein
MKRMMMMMMTIRSSVCNLPKNLTLNEEERVKKICHILPPPKHHQFKNRLCYFSFLFSFCSFHYKNEKKYYFLRILVF